ncbi:MAG: class I SAM-dependent methyltransferase [Rhodospirillaceae bacterium]|nr:class I SAM-dependent methyltransferase [Rhodospirillaceae bacterium]
MSDAALAADNYATALAARRQGDLKAALSGFLMALALAPEHPAYRREALSILGIVSGYKTLPAPVLNALRGAVSDPALDVQPLSLVVRNIIEGDDRFAGVEATLAGAADLIEHQIDNGAWDWLLNEPLLHGVLARAILIGNRLEAVFTKLRRHLLLHPSTALIIRHERLLIALALHGNTTRFPWAETPEETQRLATAAPGLAQSLYRPLASLPDAGSLPEVLRLARDAQLEAKERASFFPALTPVDDDTSRKVQAQYEQFPYPPWDAIADASPTTLNEFAKARFPQIPFNVPEPLMLSAGCGTGRGAVMLGLTFPAAKIIAFDLSRPSLVYAAMKAEQHGLRSIAFGVGDILKIGDLGDQFDLIESSGVIHHMKDPAAGLRALAEVLKPGGLIRLGLYSERGRSAVIVARALIASSRIPDTDDGVRQARQALMALPLNHPARGVIDTPEFFTLDGLHDLIFNVQESRYTPLQLKVLIASAGLTFLGFDTDAPVKAAYARAFPNDAHGVDLDNWERFEQNQPQAFAEMYQLWCYKV